MATVQQEQSTSAAKLVIREEPVASRAVEGFDGSEDAARDDNAAAAADDDDDDDVGATSVSTFTQGNDAN